MNKNPQISHFNNDESEQEKPLYTTSTDRSDLAARYPQAKSYDELAEDAKALKRAARLRFPKHPRLMIAVYGIFAPTLFAWFMQTMHVMWFSGSDTVAVLSKVSLSFLLAIAAVGLFWAWSVYTARLFSYFGGTPRLFWVAYGAFAAVLYMLMISQIFTAYTNLVWLPVIALTHFSVLYVLARYTLESEDILA